jgi:cyclophilin family peptidyl-prolyl cis-trans isomerase
LLLQMRSSLFALGLLLLAAFAAAAEQYEFTVNIEGKKEAFTIEVHPEWAPLGAARFKELVGTDGFFSGVRFFRTIKGFMTQFGIPGKPAVASEWKDKKIADDPSAGISNKRGYLSFATSGKDSRTTQMFINLVENANLDVSSVALSLPSLSPPSSYAHPLALCPPTPHPAGHGLYALCRGHWQRHGSRGQAVLWLRRGRQRRRPGRRGALAGAPAGRGEQVPQEGLSRAVLH